MAFAEGGDELGQQIVGGYRRDSHTDMGGLRVGAAELGQQALPLPKDGGGIVVYPLARRRHPHALGAALQQLLCQLVLQGFDLHGNSGLRKKHPLSSSGKTACLYNGSKHLKLMEIHVTHFLYCSFSALLGNYACFRLNGQRLIQVCEKSFRPSASAGNL